MNARECGPNPPSYRLLASSTPGRALMAYSGPPLPAGSPTPIGYVVATVPSGTTASPIPYKAKDLLHLSDVLLNGGTSAVATADAVHLVAYVGDADGNGSYSSNDAVLITRVALQTDTGFTAYPLVDPVIVADTDGADFIPADAALQANEAGVGFSTANLPNPPIPVGVVFQANASFGGSKPLISTPSVPASGAWHTTMSARDVQLGLHSAASNFLPRRNRAREMELFAALEDCMENQHWDILFPEMLRTAHRPGPGSVAPPHS